MLQKIETKPPIIGIILLYSILYIQYNQLFSQMLFITVILLPQRTIIDSKVIQVSWEYIYVRTKKTIGNFYSQIRI